MLQRGKSVRECTRRYGVPNSPGVYIISEPSGEIVYIGKAGTLQQGGSFKEQGLRGRLCAKQNGVPRQTYFNRRMQEGRLDHIEVRWFVSFDDRVKVLPAKAEADLLQAYFEDHGKLPVWNEAL